MGAGVGAMVLVAPAVAVAIDGLPPSGLTHLETRPESWEIQVGRSSICGLRPQVLLMKRSTCLLFDACFWSGGGLF